MTYGIANIAIIPLRAEPSERAEMVSQLLFGDAYSVLEVLNDKIKIQTCDCHYEGWMDKKLFNPIDEKEAEIYLSLPKYIVKDYLIPIKTVDNNHFTFPIFAGSSFPFPESDLLKLGNSVFEIHLPKTKLAAPIPDLSQPQTDIINFAHIFINAPYLWGGRSPAGIDCSGFSQILCKSIGINIPRDASQQVQIGDTVDFIEEAKVGDFAFFQNNDGNIVHVGMVYGKNLIIHASGKVRVDTLDSTGIYNHETDEYSHSLRIIKRFLKE